MTTPAPCRTASASTASARAALAAAFAAQPCEYRSFFGLTTIPQKQTTAFLWRNYLTGAWGTIARVAPPELVNATLALLDELQSLRDSQLRTPERKPPVLRKPPQNVRTWRRRTA
jgi:hypothetical protein